MSKRVVLVSCYLLLALCCGVVGYGQADTTVVFKPTTHVGVQYAYSWNQVDFSPRVGQIPFVGQGAAVSVRYVGEPHLGVQIDVSYDQRGWSEQQGTLATNYIREVDYLELAVFSHLSIGSKAVRPYFLLGSYLGYPLKESETIPADWPVVNEYYGVELPQRLQYGLAGGLGVELIVGRIAIQLDGRVRSALGGLFGADDSSFTFSNLQSASVQGAILYRLF